MSELGFSDEVEEESPYLKIKSRDTVSVGENEICKVLSFFGVVRDPLAPNIFQLANVDKDEIKFELGDEVREMVCIYDEEVQKDLNFQMKAD